MGQRITVKRASDQFTDVKAVGTLANAVLLPLEERELTQAELTVGDDTFGVQAHGELAQQVAGIPPGSLVRVEGKLGTYRWKTREKADRDRVVIVAEKVDQLTRPKKGKKHGRRDSRRPGL